MFTLRFDQPMFLLLAALAVPLLIIGWRAMANMDRLRRSVALALRTLLLLGLIFMLAGPNLRREHDHLTVIGVLDISASVQRFSQLTLPTEQDEGRERQMHSYISYLRQWFRDATKIKTPEDRFGLVVFDGRAIAISAPTRSQHIDDNLDLGASGGDVSDGLAQATNIEQALRLALAMMPPDTASRIVLVTDGNQTSGNALEALRNFGFSISDFGFDSEARNPKSKIRNPKSRASIPIDILPITYHVTNDVQLVRVETPPNAQPGQAVTVRIVLEATQPTSGMLTLLREGEPVDLSPGETGGRGRGTSRFVELPAGQSVHLAQVPLGHTPIHRFQAIFEVADPRDDILPDNNQAEAFTATPTRGSVLVLDPAADRRENLLTLMLNAADVPAQARAPSQLPHDLLGLQNFDLIVLDNVGAYQIATHQQELLSRYVTDLGGGLIMIGGEESFGAGGWTRTAVAEILPVNLDPSKELRLPSAALVLVLDRSGSMTRPVAGARATQQEVANEACALAIESLRSESLVGVIAFNHAAEVYVPLQRNDKPGEIAEQVRSINPGGATHFEPALQAAQRMLANVQAETKRVVFISDGVSYDADYEHLIAQMVSEGVKITTVAVGDQADHEALQAMALAGGGSFYPVRDPRVLPHVLVDSVRVVNKPLLKEDPFTPQVLATGSTLTAGMDAAPALGGLVITSPRDDAESGGGGAKAIIEMIHPEGEPLLAHWQRGLGRAAAFTSSAPGSGPWAQEWVDWPTSAAFWTQLARTIARPAMSHDAELIATIRNDRLHITYEISGEEPTTQSQQSALEYLQVSGAVYRPDGTSEQVRLRQHAPGRFEASVEAREAGNYIVAVNPRRGARQLAPAIGGASQSSSPEFRRYSSNINLLEELRQMTGGRTLQIEDPLALNLFDRAGLGVSVSMLPAWRTALLWTLVLLLLDVACRRIAWDYQLLRSFVLRSVARVTPSQVRGAEAAATLANLRRVSDAAAQPDEKSAAFHPAVEERRAGLQFPVDQPQSLDRQRHDETLPDAGPPPAPEPSRVTAALDALLGRKPASPKPPQPTDAQGKPDAPTSREAPTPQTTRNLLAAKKRARDKLGGRDGVRD